MNSLERGALLQVAHVSIRTGLQTGQPLVPEPDDYAEQLRRPGASFVTLHVDGALHGCIGSLVPRRPLVVDVAAHAFDSAFRDPRFPPLSGPDLEALRVHISVLNRPEPLAFASEEDLVSRLRPGLDGLILEDGPHRGTFLPAVWASVPEPRDFVRELKRKAGLPEDHWSGEIRFHRYTVESIP